MANEHTPGPWNISSEGVIESPTTWIASIVPINQYANARLIAAAPEQHDALKRARVALADIQKRWTNIPAYASADITAALNVIDAAIDKAEGR